MQLFRELWGNSYDVTCSVTFCIFYSDCTGEAHMNTCAATVVSTKNDTLDCQHAWQETMHSTSCVWFQKQVSFVLVPAVCQVTEEGPHGHQHLPHTPLLCTSICPSEPFSPSHLTKKIFLTWQNSHSKLANKLLQILHRLSILNVSNWDKYMDSEGWIL